MSKIRDVIYIYNIYIYICIWKISIFSNANVTDALSSNNGVNGGEERNAPFIFIYREKVLYGNMYV